MNNELSRREFVALMGAGLATATVTGRAQSSRQLYAYVGSWTQGPFGVGGGGGITVFTVDLSDGSLTQVSRTGPEFDNLNAGYLAISPNGRFLYSTNEVKNLNGEFGAGGGVLSFAINQDDGSIAHVRKRQDFPNCTRNLAKTFGFSPEPAIRLHHQRAGGESFVIPFRH